MAKAKYRVMKFDGDDNYSYAIFHADSVRGMNSPICHHPTPIICGMDFHEAQYRKKEMEAQAKKDTECNETFTDLMQQFT